MSESRGKSGQSWIASFVSSFMATRKLKALSVSMSARDAERVRALIDKGANVDVRDKHGVTPLYEASGKGYTEIVKLLLNASADVNAAHTTGLTPLFWASENGHTEVVQLLLEAGARKFGRIGIGKEVNLDEEKAFF